MAAGASVAATFDSRAFLFSIPAGTDLGAGFGGPLAGNRGFMGHWGYDEGAADYDIGDYLTTEYLVTFSNVVTAMTIPEPASGVMLSLLGLAVLGLRRRK